MKKKVSEPTKSVEYPTLLGEYQCVGGCGTRFGMQMSIGPYTRIGKILVVCRDCIEKARNERGLLIRFQESKR